MLTSSNACVRNPTPSAVAERAFEIRWASKLEGLALGTLYYSPNNSAYVYPLLFTASFTNGPRYASGYVREWLPSDRTPATAETTVGTVGNNWAGTADDRVEPYAEFLMITPTLCYDQRRGNPSVLAIPRTENSCDHCCAGQDCVGDPIRVANGNMRYTETDPLPNAPGFSLTRTYDSNRNNEQRWFGAGWSSVFDAWLRVVDDAESRTVVIGTPDFGRYVFHKKNSGSSYDQIWPLGQAPAKLVHDPVNGLYRLRRNQSDTELIFRTSDNLLWKIRHIPTGREISIVWTNGDPVAVEDSWQNWRWFIQTDASHRITHIAVDATSTIVHYTYDAAGRMTAVKLDPEEKLWRSYVYADGRMTAARDAAGRTLESHAYNPNGTANTSIGPSGDITSVTYAGSGRVDGEEVTVVTTAAGQTSSYYTRYFGGRRRTVEISGGCASCGSQNAVYAHDADGNVVREQNDRGYVTLRSYAQGRVVSESGPWKTASCDPTPTQRCRQTPDSLATVALAPTAATRTTTTVYGDTNWPDKPTLITTDSVTGASRTRTDAFTYDATSGLRLTHTITGWTGSPSTQQSRTTTTAIHDGTQTAAFLPGSTTFQSAWMSLPQPKGTLRSIDGPLAGNADVVTQVYYPVHEDVTPAALRGRLAATRNAAGHITTYEDYDVFGNARKITDANGAVTERTFDTLGRPLKITIKAIAGCNTANDPLCATDLTSESSYDNAGVGPLVSRKDPLGAVTVIEYDDRGRAVKTSRGPAANDLKEQIAYVFDAVTALRTDEILLAREGGAWVPKTQTKFWYDTEGRVTDTARGLPPEASPRVQNSYGPGGLLQATKDERHTVFNTQYAYDPAGRLASVKQLANAATNAWTETRYEYDIAGNLIKVRDPNNNETTYVYDDFGQMLRQTSPVTGVTTYTYDSAGNLLSSIDANNATTTRTYDASGRVTSAVSSRGGTTETVTWTYDSATAGDFGKGRIATMTDPSGSTAYRYDRRGLLREERKTIDGALYVTSHRHDANGNRASMTYPSGRVVDYTFDFAGRPTSAGSGSTAYVSSASYLPFGPMTEQVFGNGTRRVRQYDGQYRLTANTLLTSTNTPLADYAYAYDPSGNVTSIADVQDPNYNRTFAYDDLGRLTGASTGSALWGTGSYAYDAMGNMTSATLGTSRVTTFAFAGTTPKLTRVTENSISRAVSYDAAGNEQTVGSSTFLYNARNSLAVAGGFVYRHDGRGVRTSALEVGCPTMVTPAATTVGPTATTVTLTVIAAPSCSWTTSTGVSWVTAVPPSAGSGDSAVVLSIRANPTSSARTATVSIQGQDVTITQSAGANPTAAFDFGGDGRGNIVWRHERTGEVKRATLTGFTATASALFTEGTIDWKVVGVGDFDGNGRADVLERHSRSGQARVRLMGVSGLATAVVTYNDEPSAYWKVAGVGDFDGNGRSDILWFKGDTRQVSIQFMNGTTVASSAIIYTESAPHWRIAGVADFDADGRSDILWYQPRSGEVRVQLVNGTTITATRALPAEPATLWTIAGAADLDGDGDADLVWHHAHTGELREQLLDGTSAVTTTVEPKTASWKVAQVADFDGDARADVLWRNTATGALELRYRTGASGAVAGESDLSWKIIGSLSARREQAAARSDFGGDAKSDVMWRNTSTQEIAMWEMDGRTPIDQGLVYTLADGQWKIQTSGDFDGDGKWDLLWRHANTHDLAIWEMNGHTIRNGAVWASLSTDPQWKVQGAGDVDGDGKSDLVLRRADDGTVAVWKMNGRSAPVAETIGAPSLDWLIQGIADFTGDGRADVLWRHTNGSVALWTSNGSTLTTNAPFGTSSTDSRILAVADYTGDGRADILWRNTQTLQVTLWEMHGQTIAQQSNVAVTEGGWTVQATSGDFGGDRRGDVIWRKNNDLAMWEMNGTAILNGSVFEANQSPQWQVQALERNGESGESINALASPVTGFALASVGHSDSSITAKAAGGPPPWVPLPPQNPFWQTGGGPGPRWSGNPHGRSNWYTPNATSAPVLPPASGSVTRLDRRPPPLSLALTMGAIATNTQPATRRHFLYTPELNLMAETERTTSTTPAIAYEYVWFAGAPVAQIDVAANTTSWTFTDHLGTPILQTNATATPIWRAEYDPYGTLHTLRTGASHYQPLRLPGQEGREEGDRYYNVFRWYRGGWGRYTSPDPLGLEDGGINPYAYVEGNPINLADPEGLAPCSPSQVATCSSGCTRRGKTFKSCSLNTRTFCGITFQYTWCECKEWQKKCPPCAPPPPPRIDRVPPSRPHYPCPGDHWTYYEVHQASYPACTCRTVQRFGGCLP